MSDLFIVFVHCQYLWHQPSICPWHARVCHLTVGHADVRAAVCLNQLSVDGSLHQLKLQLIWSRVSIAHCQLLTAYTHTHTHTHTHTNKRKEALREMKQEKEKINCLYQTHSHTHISLSLQSCWSSGSYFRAHYLTQTTSSLTGPSSPQALLFEISIRVFFFFWVCVYFPLTYSSLSSHADLQQRVQNLKHRRLLMVRQQQDGKVQLWSGVFTVRHWDKSRHMKNMKNKYSNKYLIYQMSKDFLKHTHTHTSDANYVPSSFTFIAISRNQGKKKKNLNQLPRVDTLKTWLLTRERQNKDHMRHRD